VARARQPGEKINHDDQLAGHWWNFFSSVPD
jgi:hypothetical protein